MKHEIIFRMLGSPGRWLFRWSCSCGMSPPADSSWSIVMPAFRHATPFAVHDGDPAHVGRVVDYIRVDGDGKRWLAWGWVCSCDQHGSSYSTRGYASGTLKTHRWRAHWRQGRTNRMIRPAPGPHIEEHW